jgi:hypothetical protein
MMEEFFLILFLVAVLASGLWCVMDPEAVVRFRTRIGWSTGYLSGGFAYANCAQNTLHWFIACSHRTVGRGCKVPRELVTQVQALDGRAGV